MVEPLSITTGVLSLLGVCFNVGVELKRFRDGVAVVNITVDGLLHDVSGLEQVLESMKGTFDQANNPHPSQATGHIGNHWKNLSRSLQDGQNTLIRLQELLEGVNKSVTLLDGPRRQLRLNSAAEQIVAFRQQIQSYRDALQLSLQTIILWNQLTIQESTDKILPNLDELHREIRRIALDLHLRIRNLQNAVTNTNNEDHIDAVKNLRACVHTAASIVSSASTILTADQGYQTSVTYDSDFGDCFPSEPSESMLRWISSNTVCESAGDMQDKVATEMYRSGAWNPAAGFGVDNIDRQSDSDSELEAALIRSLQKHGKEKLASKNFKAAERLFRNCLSRLSTTQASPEDSVRRLEVMELLLETYSQQGKWKEARSILIDKLSISGLRPHKEDHTVLSDMSTLVEILKRQGNYVEAHLYGRRVLKGYMRLGAQGAEGVEKALAILVQICHDDGKVEEEDAYASMLSDFLESKEVAVGGEGTKGKGQKMTNEQGISASSVVRTLQALPTSQQSLAMGKLMAEPEKSRQAGPQTPSRSNTHPQHFLPPSTPTSPYKRNVIPSEASDQVASGGTQFSTASPPPRHGREHQMPPPRRKRFSWKGDRYAKSLAPPSNVFEKPPFGEHVTSTRDQATDRRSVGGIPPPSNVLEKLPFGGHVASTSDQATGRRSGWGIPESVQMSSNIPCVGVPDFKRKLVCVGDQISGKTSLLIRQAKGFFPDLWGWTTTVCEDCVSYIRVSERLIEITLQDTPGQEDRLRPVYYPDSHVILICFPIDNPDSLDNVMEKWISEVLHFCKGLPIILVGCKQELRDDPKTTEELQKTKQHPVTPKEGREVAIKIDAKYFECSAKTGQGVQEIFDYAAFISVVAQPHDRVVPG